MLCESAILEEFYKFKTGESVDAELIERILYFYKTPFIHTERQKWLMKKYDKRKFENFESKGGFKKLKELFYTSKFRVILSKKHSNFPFINIYGDRLENNFTASFKGKRKVDCKEVDGESREKALVHFKALFKNAKSIFIFDKYLKKADLEKLINECEISEDKIFLTQKKQNEFKMCKIDKTNRNLTKSNTHDRYIVIDGKIDIILTSGFEYLFDTDKDFTYVLKEK